jgi:iron(III) transport system permease protein
VRAAPSAAASTWVYAATTATLCVAIGLVSWRLPLGTVLWLPFLVPGVLLGIGMIVVFNRPGLDWVYGSVALVVVAFTIRYLALAWNGVAHARRTVDRDLTDAARLEGAHGWTLLRWVHWPQIAPQAGAVWYVTYLLCLWDVETLLLLYPAGGETLALRVFNLLHYGHHAQVNAACLLMLAMALAPLAIGRVSRKRTRMANDQ